MIILAPGGNREEYEEEEEEYEEYEVVPPYHFKSTRTTGYTPRGVQNGYLSKW